MNVVRRFVSIFTESKFLLGLSLFFLLVGLLGGLAWMFNSHHLFLGELHTPHEDPRVLHLKSGREFQQTFVAEGEHVRTLVLFSAEPFPAHGEVTAVLEDGDTSAHGVVALDSVFPGGELYVSFSPPLRTTVGNTVTLRLTSSGDVNLKYQIDSSIYEQGTLSIQAPPTPERRSISGDLAFQFTYDRLAAHSVQLTFFLAGGLVVISLAGWIFLVWLLSLPVSPVGQSFFSRTDVLTLGCTLLVIGVVYGYVLFHPLRAWSTNFDYIKDVVYLQSAVDAVRSGSLPAWAMHICGGQPLLGNPEANTLSVGTVLAGLLGPAVGMKFFLWFELLGIAVGTYLLARMLGVSPLSAVWPALIFTLNGFLANRIPTATMFVAGALSVPWMILTYLKSFTRPYWILVCALVGVLTFFAGDTHVVMYTCLAIAVLGVVRAVQYRTFRPVILLGVVGAFMVLLGAVKIFPSLEGQSHYHGKQLPPLVVLLSERKLVDDFFLNRSVDHEAAITEHGKPEGWDNIGMYVGIVPLVVGLIGIFFAPREWRLSFILLLGLFFVLGEGSLYEFGLRPLGGEVRSLFRLPSRTLVIFILGLGMTGGFMLDWVYKKLRIGGVILAVALLVFIAIDLGGYSAMTINRIKQIPPSVSAAKSQPALTVASMDVQRSNKHPLAILTNSVAVGGVCPDFNNTPSFVKNGYEGPLITDMGGSAANMVMSSQEIIVTPSIGQRNFIVHMAASPLLEVEGAFVSFLPDGSFKLFVSPSASTVRVRYASSVMQGGILMSLGVLGASLLLFFYGRRQKPIT